MIIWLILFCLCCSCCCSVECLKCRSQEGHGEQELKRVVRSCMHRSGSNNNGNGNGNGQDDNEDSRGYGRTVHRYDYGQQEQDGRSKNGYRWQRSLKQQSENRNSSEGSEGGQCVAQCFFEEMNMADGNGLPDRRKVSYMLTKDLRDRELRNFFMDTVQQCFRYLENGRNRSNNKCSQARELVKCMSEYAKAQCDDWEEYGSLLFN